MVFTTETQRETTTGGVFSKSGPLLREYTRRITAGGEIFAFGIHISTKGIKSRITAGGDDFVRIITFSSGNTKISFDFGPRNLRNIADIARRSEMSRFSKDTLADEGSPESDLLCATL